MSTLIVVDLKVLSKDKASFGAHELRNYLSILVDLGLLSACIQIELRHVECSKRMSGHHGGEEVFVVPPEGAANAPSTAKGLASGPCAIAADQATER
jgi:hypothetical protein